MVSVMIVDNDYSYKNAVISSINWENYDLQIICTAEDGLDGYNKYLSCKPDIVITDVKLPIMDGFELINKILNSSAPECEFLILSAREDFEYLQRALRLGVGDYILKNHQKNNELLDGILRLKFKVEQKRDSLAQISNLDQKINYLKNIFLLKLINGDIKDDIYGNLKFYDLVPPHKNYIILNAISDTPLVLDDTLSDCWQIVCGINDRHSAVIAFFDDEQTVAEIIKSHVKLNPNANIGIGDIGTDVNKIHEIYIQSEVALKNAISSKNILSFYIPTIYENCEHKIVRTAFNLIKSKYSSSLSVNTVAEKLGISPSHFMHIFKAHTGKTFHEVLTEYRMEAAIKLMNMGIYKVYKVGDMVGYDDIRHFRKKFKEYTGLSPTEYKSEQ